MKVWFKNNESETNINSFLKMLLCNGQVLAANFQCWEDTNYIKDSKRIKCTFYPLCGENLHSWSLMWTFEETFSKTFDGLLITSRTIENTYRFVGIKLSVSTPNYNPTSLKSNNTDSSYTLSKYPFFVEGIIRLFSKLAEDFKIRSETLKSMLY